MVKSNVEKTAAERSDSSLYRGIRKRKWGKWVSEIKLPNSRQRIWLGSYDSAEKAVRAFDAATFCLRGSGAKFNFPSNPPDIPRARSMTHYEIQAAATRFANSDIHNDKSDRPDNKIIETPSLSEVTALLPMELQPPALSDTTVQTESNVTDNGLFTHMFSETESGYSMFPAFDDFCGEFYVPEMTNFDYQEEKSDRVIILDSFLWNF
ncbi:hypothetical protein TSUD_407370 [Trifolium subterraneum]|uniref:AP2/ERF domain-containing protein n=1 Tax=Trifolium subterraneum TaxID=3900 RepID=A0A2Z6PHI4_TRISU|nr:hypothetical protein TSUD_407370 [Trifolium subterraneum]